MIKTCTKCKRTLHLEDFKRDRTKPDGLQSQCNDCRKLWRQENKQYQKDYFLRNKERYKASQKNSHLRKHFGLSLQEYKLRLQQQAGVCAICGLKEWRTVKGTVCSLSVDHNHKTGKIRELLCDRCNLIIGRSKESPELLNKIIQYLIKHGGKR